MDIDTYIAEAKKRLRSQGGRVTKSREETLRLIFAANRPLSATDIEDGLNGHLSKKVDSTTVFRMLNAFVELGLLHRLDDSSSYIACKHFGCSHGYHVVLHCKKCGSFKEVELPESIFDETRRFCETEYSFLLSDTHGQLEGTCEACS